MPQFSYKARRRTGEVVEGVLEVADRSAALVQIERLGLFPVAVDAAKGGQPRAERADRQKRDWGALLPPALREVLTRKRSPNCRSSSTLPSSWPTCSTPACR